MPHCWPQVLAIIGVTYTAPIASAPSGLRRGDGACLGLWPVIGMLIQADLFGLGWRTCFLVNIPIGLAALLLAPSAVCESRAPISRRLDGFGAILLALTIGSACCCR